MLNIFFSIIIPIYNSDKYIEKCLNSVLVQSERNFEVICINDGSTDNSLRLLQQFQQIDDRILIINQLNSGMSVARNKGLEIARGEYVFFLDSDDWILPNTFKILKTNVENNDMLCFNSKIYCEETDQYKIQQGYIEKSLTGWNYFNKYAIIPSEIHFVCVWQRIYKNEFIKKTKLKFKEGISRAEDNLFTTMACFHAKSVKVISDCCYVYRVRQSSITNSLSWDRMLQSFQVNNDLAIFFISQKKINKKNIYKIISSSYINAFSDKIVAQYGNRDKELKGIVNWNYFYKSSNYIRHRFLFILIVINPQLYRFYIKCLQ